MKIKTNPAWTDDDVQKFRASVKANEGYCPCRLTKTPETKCMCKEFKEQISDPHFEGFCHCMLYYKSLKD